MALTLNGTTGIVTPGVTDTGDLSVAGNTALTTPLPVTSGGTGATSLSGITVGTATNATNATTATNLAGGGAGQIPYQSASGTTAMLAAGTSGQALLSNGSSAPSWGSAGATTLISSATASSSATVDMTFPSGYSAYQVIFYNVTNSVETRFEMAYTTDAFATVTNWDSSVIFVWTSSSSSSSSDTTAGVIVLNRPTTSTYPASGSIIFPGASASGARKSYVGNVQSQLNTSPLYTGMCGGINSSTSAINGVRFKFSSGNITTGTFKLYGIT